MFLGQANDRQEFISTTDVRNPNKTSEEEEEEMVDTDILYTAAFDELVGSYLQYETIIWLSISLLLVLAWGVGAIMLMYLPYKRYVLKKDLLSRQLYVTPTEVVYKVSRPSYIPFRRTVRIHDRVPLSLVINIIIEQGCLQSAFGLQTFRLESISRGKTAPVDELQVQGVSSPGLLRKVILIEASKVIKEAGTILPRMPSLTDRSASFRSPSQNRKVVNSPYSAASERKGIASGDLLLHKLDEVNKSVKRIESLVTKSQMSTDISLNIA